MKRLTALIATIGLSALIIAGCGSSAKEADLNAVMDKINSQYSLSLEKLDSADKLARYYGVDPADVKTFAAEQSKSVNAPVEIIMIEAKDADAATRVEKALNTRYDSVLRTYNSYTPEQVEMVKACKVTKDGNFVSLIIADKAADMVKVYQEAVQ